MKTAIIIAGATRQVNLSYKFWDKLPQGDLYYSTWDLSQSPYSTKLFEVNEDIKNLTSKVEFKEVIVSDYKTECLQTKMHPYMRPFHLLRKVHEKIKNQGYQRVIYFRPDIKLFYLDDYNPELDFAVTDNSIRLLGDHHDPREFYNVENGTMNDLFFVFPWNIFELFLNNAEFISNKEIHRSLYDFFKTYRIKVTPVYNMRCVVLRNNINEDNINLGIFELTDLFLNEYHKTKHLRKFFTAEEMTLESKTETITSKEVNTEYLKFSQNNGGILKLRNK